MTGGTDSRYSYVNTLLFLERGDAEVGADFGSARDDCDVVIDDARGQLRDVVANEFV